MITAEELSLAISQTPSWCTLTATAQARVIIDFIQSRAAGVQGADDDALRKALTMFMDAKAWIASDSWDGIDKNGRDLMEQADVAARTALATPQPPKDAGAVPMPEPVAKRSTTHGGEILCEPVYSAAQLREYGDAREAAARAQVAKPPTVKESLTVPQPIPQSLTAGGDGGEAAGYVTTDGTVTWYTDDFGTISRKPKPGTDVYVRPSPVADAEPKTYEVRRWCSGDQE